MQTFLPCAGFVASAKVLDYRRLGKQRIEARQILAALKTGNGWRNHPAVLMWKGYELALISYSNEMIREWKARGYNNNMEILPVDDPFVLPTWFGDDRFHASHRSNLLRKDWAYYSQYKWPEPDNLPYFWPTKEEEYK